MKNFSFIFAILIFSLNISAQSSVKGFKHLEKAEYDKALETFFKYLKEDSTNSVANFGIAVAYSADNYPDKNFFKAWDYFVKANQSFAKLTPQENDYLKQYFSDRDAHRRNRTNRYNYDFEMKMIEDKLIKYVREENNIEIAEHFIRVYPQSKYYENVVHIRNHIEFRTAEKANTLEAYQTFMKKYPNAAQIPKTIKACYILAFELARKKNSIEGYNTFMKMYPEADQYFEALKIRDQLAFDDAKKKNTMESLDAFILNYPKALQLMAARTILRKLLYDKAKEVNTLEAYNDFILRYPEGEYFVDIFNLKANVLGKTIASKFEGNTDAIVWVKGFDYANKKNESGGICVTQAGTIILAGTRSKVDEEGTESWVIALDNNGKVQWNKPFGSKIYNQSTLMHFSPDGNLMIAGWAGPSRDTSYRTSWIYKITPSGNGLWEKTLEGSEIKNFVTTTDGDIYTCGYQLDDTLRVKAFLLKINPELKKLWSRQYLTKGCLNSILLNSKNELLCGSGKWQWKVDKQGYILTEKYFNASDSICSLNAFNNQFIYNGLRNNAPLLLKYNETGLAVGEVALSGYPTYNSIISLPLSNKRTLVIVGSIEGLKALVLDEKNQVVKMIYMPGCRISGPGAALVGSSGEILLTITSTSALSLEDIAAIKLNL